LPVNLNGSAHFENQGVNGEDNIIMEVLEIIDGRVGLN
jgi:hypothetical protein